MKLWQTAFRFLFETQRAMLEIDSGPYVAAADACRSVGLWDSALSALCRARQDGIDQVTNVSNAVGSAVFRCAAAEWPRVLRLLLDLLASSRDQRVLVADQISFGTAITACSRTFQWYAAICVVQLMRRWKIFPDSVPLTSAAATCNRAEARTRAWCWSLHLFNWAVQSRHPPNLVLHNCAIAAASRGAQGGNWPRAVQQLEHLQGSRLKADRVSMSAVFAACQRAAAAEPALRMLAKLPGQRIRACAICHSSVVMACAAKLKWQEGAALIPFLKKSIHTRQAFLSSVIKATCWRESLLLFSFSHVPGEGSALAKRTDLAPALEACCASGQYWSARHMLQDARAHGWQVTVQEQALAVQSCNSPGTWIHALSIYDESWKHGLSTRDPALSLLRPTVLAACALLSGSWRVAWSLTFEDSRAASPSPLERAFDAELLRNPFCYATGMTPFLESQTRLL